jgi:hypothetical protein
MTGMFGPEGKHEKGCMLFNFDFRDYIDEHQAVIAWNSRPAALNKTDVLGLSTACQAWIDRANGPVGSFHEPLRLTKQAIEKAVK